jgi:hypothetical protein
MCGEWIGGLFVHSGDLNFLLSIWDETCVVVRRNCPGPWTILSLNVKNSKSNYEIFQTLLSSCYRMTWYSVEFVDKPAYLACS